MNSNVINRYRFQVIRLIHCGSVSSNRVSPVLDSIIRVDHAGELGADRIYAGQMAVLGNTKMGPVIQHMWEQEKFHKETFERLIVKYRARPTIMVPIWNVAGFLLGAGTALMGEKAAMACTVAVESVIVDHYNDQLRTLMAEPEMNKELLQTIQKFRDDEQDHHDSGLDHGAEQAPFYKGLTEIIKLGCKAAIAISKDTFLNRRISYTNSRSYTTSVNSEALSQKKEKWDLCSAICLERKAVVLKDLNSIEKEYMELLSDLEFEKSFKSDHEIRKEEDIERIKKLKSEATLSQTELDTLSRQTAQEYEDACSEEYKSFKTAPRITTADEKDDLKSLRRKLDRNLFLLIREKNKEWHLPVVTLKEGETMRLTAERALRETCGNILKVAFMGNAPYGFYKYKYPKSLKMSSIGAKVFFFKAVYLSGQIELSDKSNIEYQWATFPELTTLITNGNYLKKIKRFVLDDTDYLERINNKSIT